MALAYRAGSSGTSGTTAVSSMALSFPAGTTTGDLVIATGYVISTTAGTWTKSAGTGTWNFLYASDVNTGLGGMCSFCAWTVVAASDTAPTMAVSGITGRGEWQMVTIIPDAGQTPSVDVATHTITTAGGTSFTIGALTAAGTGEVSVLLNHFVKTATGTGTITITDESGWTFAAGGSGQTGATGQYGANRDAVYKTGVSGTVTPTSCGASISSVFTGYHVLVTEAAAGGAAIPDLVMAPMTGA